MERGETFIAKMRNSLNERKLTFLHWPYQNVDYENFAEAGFFYLSVDDAVQCPWCKLILRHVERLSDPWCLHYGKSPTCKFINKQTTLHVGTLRQKIYHELNIEEFNEG